MNLRLALAGALYAGAAFGPFAAPLAAAQSTAKLAEIRTDCPAGTQLNGLGLVFVIGSSPDTPFRDHRRLEAIFCGSGDPQSRPERVAIPRPDLPPNERLERGMLQCPAGTLAAMEHLADRERQWWSYGLCRDSAGNLTRAEYSGYQVFWLAPFFGDRPELQSARAEYEANLPRLVELVFEGDQPTACRGPVLGIGAQQRHTIDRIWLRCGPPVRFGATEVAAPRPNGLANVPTDEPCTHLVADGGAGRSPDAEIERREDCPERINSMAIAAPPPPAPPEPPPPESICETRRDVCSVSRRGSRVRPPPNEPAPDPPPPLGGR